MRTQSISDLIEENRFLFVLACLSLLLILVLFTLKIIRYYGKVKVNCWFCNKDSTTKYTLRNAFTCQYCGQYNGFNAEGDYNCKIPAQHFRAANSQIYTQHVKKVNPSGNGLCDTCNYHQELKVKALAEYSDPLPLGCESVESFREKVEEIYALCQKCQAVVTQTLGKQDFILKSKILAWRLLETKNNLLKSSLEKYQKSKRHFTAKCSSLIILLCIGFIIWNQLTYAKFTIADNIKNFAWKNYALSANSVHLCVKIGILTAIFFLKKSKLKKFFATILVCESLCHIAQEILHEMNVNFEPIYTALTTFFTPIVTFIFDYFFFSPTDAQLMKKNEYTPSYKDDMSSSFINQSHNFNNIDSAPTLPSRIDSVPNFSGRNTPIVSRSCTPNNSTRSNTPVVINKIVENEENLQSGDLNSTLSDLKIGTPKKSLNRDVKSLFSGSLNKRKSRDLIQPTKFLNSNSITSSSWVAGGYWSSPGSPQRGRKTSQSSSMQDNGSHESRSSSQSSGFVSHYSDFNGPSYAPSEKFFLQNNSRSSSRASSVLSNETLERNSAANSVSLNNTLTPTPSMSEFSLNNFDLLSHSQAQAPSKLTQWRCSSTCNTSEAPFQSFVSSTPNTSGESVKSFIEVSQKSKESVSWLNLSLAFVLGISVSGNLFLAAFMYYTS